MSNQSPSPLTKHNIFIKSLFNIWKISERFVDLYHLPLSPWHSLIKLSNKSLGAKYGKLQDFPTNKQERNKLPLISTTKLIRKKITKHIGHLSVVVEGQHLVQLTTFNLPPKCYLDLFRLLAIPHSCINKNDNIYK